MVRTCKIIAELGGPESYVALEATDLVAALTGVQVILASIAEQSDQDYQDLLDALAEASANAEIQEMLDQGKLSTEEAEE